MRSPIASVTFFSGPNHEPTAMKVPMNAERQHAHDIEGNDMTAVGSPAAA